MQIILRRAAAALLAALSAGCGTADSNASADTDPGGSGEATVASTGAAGIATGGTDPATRADGVSGSAPWTARSTRGTTVRVDPDPYPIQVGPVDFDIELARAPKATDALPVTVDLVSPTMPMHGIQRFTATPTGAHTYSATLEIPMAGEWIIYVNLNAGGDAASFRFTVPEGSGPSADSMETAGTHHGTDTGA